MLYLFEPVDEFVMEGLGKYKEWDFKSAESAADDALTSFADKEAPEKETAAPLSEEDNVSFDKLLARMKEFWATRSRTCACRTVWPTARPCWSRPTAA